MSRRSTRLSSSDTMALPSPNASSSTSTARRSSTRSTITTSDALPTTTASRAAGKRTGREMRFSQVLAAQEAEEEKTNVQGTGDASSFVHERVIRRAADAPKKGKHKTTTTSSSSSVVEGSESMTSGKRKRTTDETNKEVERKSSTSRRVNGGASPKAPRPTDGEDWFTREAPAVVLNRTVYAALPDVGETPIIARNKLFRNGGLSSSSGPSSDSLSASGSSTGGLGGASSSVVSLGRGAPPIRRGRTSMDLKRARRTSTNFTDGSAAFPHDSVPDSALFNHCPVQTDQRSATSATRDLSDVERMRFLAGCSLKRGIEAGLQGESAPLQDQVRQAALQYAAQSVASEKDKKQKKARQADLAQLQRPRECDAAETRAALDKHEKESLARVAPLLGEALRQTLHDLMQGSIDIDWHKRPPSEAAQGEQSHPQNLVNQTTHARLDGIVQAMRSESAAWQDEVASLDAYEAETVALLASARSARTHAATAAAAGPSSGGDAEEDVTAPPRDDAWGMEDLSEAAKQQLEDARAALAAEAPWAAGAGGSSADAAVRAANAANLAAGLVDAKAYQGTELDTRWSQIEFNADQLRHRTHTYANLANVASRYLSTVSARAAEALRTQGRLTQPAAAGPSTSTVASSSAEGSGAASETAQSRNNVEALLSGARRRVGMASTLPLDQEPDTSLDAANETQGDLLMALVATSSKR